jgi:hypothetical protein
MSDLRLALMVPVQNAQPIAQRGRIVSYSLPLYAIGQENEGPSFAIARAKEIKPRSLNISQAL